MSEEAGGRPSEQVGRREILIAICIGKQMSRSKRIGPEQESDQVKDCCTLLLRFIKWPQVRIFQVVFTVSLRAGDSGHQVRQNIHVGLILINHCFKRILSIEFQIGQVVREFGYEPN